MLLFEAARAQLCQNVVLPALESGTHVLSDRFIDSTTAYQGCARGLGIEIAEIMNKFATIGGKAYPDRTYLLDIEVAEGFGRLHKDGEELDRMELAGDEFHRKVRQGYVYAAAHDPRFCVVDASGTIEEVEEAIWQDVKQLLC
jgi:dTMP kinase